MENEFENENEQTENYGESDEQYSYNENSADANENDADITCEEETQPPVYEFNVTKQEKKKHPFLKTVAIALVFGIVGGVAFGMANMMTSRYATSKIKVGTTNVTMQKSDSDVNLDTAVTAISDECMPAIVAITNKSVSDVMTFFGKYSQESTSTGSGIVIGKNDNELLIVTNYHVVANSKELSVIFSSVESELELQNSLSDAGGSNENSSSDMSKNKSIPPATVKGYNSDKDLAVIAVELKDIPADVLSKVKVAKIGDSSKLKPGNQVVAIGNALGYGQSVTVGYISAVNRKVTMESADGTPVSNSFIQTDAAINPGNSGGALLNMAGEVIGINSVKIAANGIEGMGYAIPISDVDNIIDELMVKKTRSVVDEDKQGFLGITGADVTSANSQTFGIPIGVYVNSVMKGLAAENAGIEKGYVITGFDGYTITSIAQLQDRLTYYKAGEKVDVTVQIPVGVNKYEEKKIKVKLSNRSKNIDAAEEAVEEENR